MGAGTRAPSRFLPPRASGSRDHAARSQSSQSGLITLAPWWHAYVCPRVSRQRRGARLAARPVWATRGGPVSASPASGRGGSPGGGWPWLSSAGTPGSAAPAGSGAAPGAGGAWPAGALAAELPGLAWRCRGGAPAYPAAEFALQRTGGSARPPPACCAASRRHRVAPASRQRASSRAGRRGQQRWLALAGSQRYACLRGYRLRVTAAADTPSPLGCRSASAGLPGHCFLPPVGAATWGTLPHPSAPQGAEWCAASAATLCSRHGQSAQPAADRSVRRW